MMSAKTYKIKYAEPLIKRLTKFIYNLARRCFRAEQKMKQATRKMAELYKEKEQLKSENWDLRMANSKMSVEVRNFKRIKDFLGIDRVQELLKTINTSRRKNVQKKQLEQER